MSAITKYLPTAWLDEYVPPAQADPNTFLCQSLPDRKWQLIAIEDNGDLDENWTIPVENGQVIAFLAHRFYGTHTITIREDGQIDAPTIPQDANCFILDQKEETFCDSLHELARNGIEANGTPLPAGNHDVSAWFWANTETHFRAVIDGNHGRLEPCAGAN